MYKVQVKNLNRYDTVDCWTKAVSKWQFILAMVCIRYKWKKT